MPAKTYEGTPCAAFGHTTRYVQSGACVACALAYIRTWRVNNKEHDRAAKKAYYKAHRLKIVARTARWRIENPERTRAHADKKYGRCSVAAMAARRAHDGTCAICGTTKPGGRGTWHADHVHDGSGDVRGLLCHRCNTGIGSLQDSPRILASALAYVSRPARYKGQLK